MPKEQNSEEKNPWQTLSERNAYENPWIRISHRDVLNPSGGAGIYGVVHFKNQAIGVVPIDAEGNTWLVGQYRYTLNQFAWEIPEGGCPLGTEPLDSAKRELLEETGLSATKWTFLLDYHTSNSVTDEYGVAYIAQELTQGAAEPEETEDLKIWKLSLQEAIAMAMDGRITDGVSVMALLKVQVLLMQGQLEL